MGTPDRILGPLARTGADRREAFAGTLTADLGETGVLHSRPGQVRYGTSPQTNPVIPSVLLDTADTDLRWGTVPGIVGAGGIGVLLSDRIAAYRWDEARLVISLIIAVVYLIDDLSGQTRARLNGK